MVDWLAAAARSKPSNLAVRAPDAQWTYAELDARATELANRLAGLGAMGGTLVGTALPSTAEHVALLHAIPRTGSAAVPLDPRLPAQEIARRAAWAGCAVVIAETALERVRAVTPAALAAGPAGKVDPVPSPLHSLVFTSGTSGQARAAMLTRTNFEFTAHASAANLPLGGEDRWLALVPLFHVGGLAVLARCALARAAVELLPRFDPGLVLDALDGGATLASMVPTMLQRTLDARGLRPWPATLRAILLGGDAAPRRLLDACAERDVPVLPTYGLTEACSQVASAAPGDKHHPRGSVGRPLPGIVVRIAGGGEILVRAPSVMQGYWREENATRAVLKEGWLHTGDLGRLDGQGYLWVTGRASDRIITGGENVDPAEVEEALRTHPAVADACVVGLPDATWGQIVAAAVVLRAPATAEVLEAHCRERLARYQMPRRFGVLDDLPRTASGKPRRSDVRALLST